MQFRGILEANGSTTPQVAAMSRSRPLKPLVAALVAAAALVLGACAPAPIYKTDAATVAATPQQVATSPQNFHGAPVVWAGTVVHVSNFPDHSEIEILGYPMDRSQRPRLKQPANGRFIAWVSGYVEPLDYPTGAPITVVGTVQGTRQGSVGEAAYTFPVLRSTGSHRWTADEMRQGHPNISIGVGVGGWIH